MATTPPQSENGIDSSSDRVESFALPANWAAHGGRERRRGPAYYAVRVRFGRTSIRSGSIRLGSAFGYAGTLVVEYVQPGTRDVVTRTHEAVQHQSSEAVLPSCLWGAGVESVAVVIHPRPLDRGGNQHADDRLLALAHRLYDVDTTP